MASRMQVANRVANLLPNDRHEIILQAAAWLTETGRAHQARYMARDIAGILAERGYVLVRITTARPLGEAAKEHIETFITRATGARQLEIEEIIDPDVIGGVKIETPLAGLDGTVRTKLARYVEGVRN
jgi:F0F1-type ATP synthase delta subunit